jgi:CheY-like chemotaxis protein
MAKILVVDDDQFVLSFVAKVLRRARNSVDEAPSPEVAKNFIIEHGPYDTIFTDLEMPFASDGEELLHFIKANGREARVVLMTSRLKEEEVLAPYDDRLEKPFSPGGVLACLG